MAAVMYPKEKKNPNQQTQMTKTNTVMEHSKQHTHTSKSIKEEKLTLSATLAEDIWSCIPEAKKKTALKISTAANIGGAEASPKNSLAPLLALSPKEFLDTWAIITQRRNWSNSTVVSRINSLFALTKVVPLAQRNGLTQIMSRIRRTASEIQVPAWQPEDELQCMSAKVAQSLWAIRYQDPLLIFPIVWSWVLGQRNGDILLWRTGNVRFLSKANGLSSVSVLVVEGKTVAKSGPFTIHIPPESTLAKDLTEHAEKRRAKKLPYLFLQTNSLLNSHAETRALAIRQQHLMKKHFQGDLRATRRGGLSSLSIQALPEAQICTLSRHPDLSMLRRYLAAGRLNTTEARQQMEAITINEAQLDC